VRHEILPARNVREIADFQYIPTRCH